MSAPASSPSTDQPFALQRRMMVDCQIRTYDVTDARILDAMDAVARETFVAPEDAVLAYTDQCAAASAGPRGPQTRYLLAPMVLARLIQALEISAGDSVLDVAAGTGYASAVMAALGARVTAIESDPALVARASTLLAGTGIEIVQGALATGPNGGDFDAILLNGSFEVEPAGLFALLKDGGRLAGVKGSGRAGRAMLYRKSGSVVSGRPVFDAAAPALVEFEKIPAFTF
jgi:protein-L-isoaspartate(D-aspartate) O-methyltransferase